MIEDTYWGAKIKKLALAYETGWEYRPGSEEAGSVLTDIFMEMAKRNQERLKRVWEKQEMVFLKAVPEPEEVLGGRKGTLLIKASGAEDGKWLEEGTKVSMPREEGRPLRFRTVRSLQLTSARLKYAVYCRGLCAWLAYEAKEGEPGPVPLFQAAGEALAHPVFRWRFPGLCDGREEVCFRADFGKEECPAPALSGSWTVSDGETELPLEWRQTEDGCLLKGQTPEFAANLKGEPYEIRLELSAEEELPEEWLKTLYGGFFLTRDAEEAETDICLTDDDAGSGKRLLPFGSSPEEASCCYLSCDRIIAGEEKEIILRFRESVLLEERIPEPLPEEYKKLYKKYPWLRTVETVQEWKVGETKWEYFNGTLWRILPGSEDWQTFCGTEEGERAYRWVRPADMEPCMAGGEEHFYLRLRLSRVSNAYAAYYRKWIPVLENIRFSAGKRRMAPNAQLLPERKKAGEERMYLGFTGGITPGNCWYTGEGACSFAQEQIKGAGELFGRTAFWVEWTERRAGELSCLAANYVPIRQEPEEGEGDEDGEEELQIGAGTEFYAQPRDMGILDAVCPSEVRYDGAGVPVRQEKKAAENYFMHFGRMLTPMDMELMLQERYPFLKIGFLAFRQKERRLDIELALVEGEKLSPMPETSEKEARKKLPEIREWLETAVSKQGALWLKDCCVHCTLREAKERGKDR